MKFKRNIPSICYENMYSCVYFSTDWEVLRLVLQELPQVLQNKSLILTKQGNNEVDLLVDAVCGLVSDTAHFSFCCDFPSVQAMFLADNGQEPLPSGIVEH